MGLNIFLFNVKRATNYIDKYKNLLKFKLYGVKYGKSFCIHGSLGLFIDKDSKFIIGNSFYYSSGKHINPLCGNKQGNIHVNKLSELIIGDHVGMSSTIIWCHKSIKIGNYVNIGANTIILDSDCHSLFYLHRRDINIDVGFKHDAPIIIEDDVLIGMNCIIMKGVTIGARSIIGAGSVVTKSIPPDSVAAGNPCVVLRALR